MQSTQHKTFATPDETREFPHGKAEILQAGDGAVGRLVLQPCWRWSNDVKPIAGTSSCEAPHFQYHVSGRLAIRMDDGTEFIAGPETSPRCPVATTPGSLAMSRPSLSTGMAPAATPAGADQTPLK